jgi:hypothetical protein
VKKKQATRDRANGRPPEQPNTARPALWLVIALDQLAAAGRSLVLLEAARWDPVARCYRLPRDDGALGGLPIPPEFTRDIGLGRLPAAVRERAELWQSIATQGRGCCLWCRQPVPVQLLTDHVLARHWPAA